MSAAKGVSLPGWREGGEQECVTGRMWNGVCSPSLPPPLPPTPPQENLQWFSSLQPFATRTANRMFAPATDIDLATDTLLFSFPIFFRVPALVVSAPARS